MSENRFASGVRTALSRHDFSTWSYVAWFCVVNILSIIILQWGVNSKNPVWNSFAFVGQVFQGRFMALNEFLLVGIMYFILIMVTNRFWLASQIMLDLSVIITVMEYFKLVSRSETIVPADLNFISGGNTGDIAEWLPSDALWVITCALIVMIITTALMIIVGHRDTRRGVVYAKNVLIRTLSRFLAAILAFTFLASFIFSMSSIDSWSNNWITTFGDSPKLWDSKVDSYANGTAVAFSRLVNPKIMDEPSGYSKQAMEQIVQKYTEAATQVNSTRSRNLTDSTVIYILSESFSDPSRVPGLKLNKDVMPKIRAIKENTTSGLMLSSGYGGGTANLEYMALSGMSMANFAPSLSSPYQQLIPNASWTPTVNQLWKSGNSYAFHPYESNMYSRSSNYKKFGFSQFWTLDPPEIIEPQDTLGTSKYVSDKAAYTAVLNSLKKDAAGETYFYQLATMQNHMPYKNYYAHNEIEAESTTGTPLGKNERTSIETFAKGAEYTDGYTQDFLDELDKLDRPVSVVFYGDHLPGAYTSAAKEEKNSLALHETDYFIWSNKASGIDNKAAGDSATNSAYTSPNFFTSQLAEHMNAKVSPYMAFLEALHAKVSAMEPAVVNKIQGWTRIPAGQGLYLDNEGKLINVADADEQTKQLLEDYKLIQYDVTAGNHYLKDTAFMSISQ
ncbi:LTA synthase family protein [Alloscardovia macacae]|uniref:Arylsulfatase n=1 Tax=Alloscardovia macacae TaxID=1160091 RepID=A0A261F3W1_9BIFI|nr:alkaline phosphatase family protein [Alloscardovia macacae]OZG53819.1 arylsulfatase [Alloscardovia macacae]